MSYDPTIGRWLSEDPIAFQAADPNLYRYVGNDPPNLIDSSGLEERLIKRFAGEQVKDAIKEASFPFKGGTGNVEVWKDVEYGFTKDDTIENAIELQFTVKNAKEDKNDPVGDTHWLQFTNRNYIDSKTKKPMIGTYRGTGRFKKLGLPGWTGPHYLDTGSANKDFPFYDSMGPEGEYRRTKTEISIFDRPSVDTNDDISEKRAVYDAYLISGNNVYYHVHWERVNNDGDREYTKISGERVDRLPYWALGNDLIAGYADNKLTMPIKFRNPISEATRKKWAAEAMGRLIGGY